MIYEARPNVTVDVASLCLKSGNAALLRGGHAAERTNAATLGVIAPVLEAHGFESALVQSVDQYGRAGATAMMEARGHIDVLVPRGGAGLIQAVVRNSKVRSSKPVPATCISISTSPVISPSHPDHHQRQNPARGRVQRRRKAIGS